MFVYTQTFVYMIFGAKIVAAVAFLKQAALIILWVNVNVINLNSSVF